jgi:AAA+ ATPase superfamily predicted ATPase
MGLLIHVTFSLSLESRVGKTALVQRFVFNKFDKYVRR